MDVSRETCLKGFGKQQWPVYQDRHFVGFVLGRQGDVLSGGITCNRKTITHTVGVFGSISGSEKTMFWNTDRASMSKINLIIPFDIHCSLFDDMTVP